MPKALKSVAADALELSPEDRAVLAQQLMDSLPRDPEVAAAWDAEIDRRVAQYESRELELIPAEQVFAEARARRQS